MSAPTVSALRGTPHPPPAAAPASRAEGTSHRPGGEPPEHRLLHALPARAMAFVLLLLFGALHWMRMLEPPAPERAWFALGAAAITAAGLLAARPLRRRRARALAVAVGLAGGLSAAVLGAGAADELLAPYGWDELVAGVVRGAQGLPGARVPYRGLDEWLRLVIALGGTLLAVVAAALAFWPRRRGRTGYVGPAVLALVTLYAVPAVALIFDGEFIRGAVLAILVLAFLRLERLRRRDAAAAALAATAAACAALAVAPALDRIDPWWDYETWALSAGGARSTAFDWSHDYGPLDWPRDGRELLRIRSGVRTYWKADQLDRFDGHRWVGDLSLDSADEAPGVLVRGVPDVLRRRWTSPIRAVVRHLRSRTFVTAGATWDIRMPRRPIIPTGRPGVHRTTRPLRRGDAYRALVYVPRPTPRQLRKAPADYEWSMLRYQRIEVHTGGFADGAAGSGVPVEFSAFGAAPSFEGGNAPALAREAIRSSDLRRTYRLSRRLLAQARTPYEYLLLVRRHLARGFVYTESPPASAGTLERFLFEGRRGTCQQFSGAMALLLRMGGVPTRVATGFSPGTYDEESREYVVRDFDAHSWVEAWFPGIGWVPFDPTPSSSPARSQVPDSSAAAAAVGDVADLGVPAELDDRRAGSDAVLSPGRAAGWALAAAVVALLVRAGVRRRRRFRPAGPVAELERALRVAGADVPPGTTLAAVEARFAEAPGAAAYLRALRLQRYAAGGSSPTLAQRRELRRALGRGGGPLRRLRAYAALPPWPRVR